MGGTLGAGNARKKDNNLYNDVLALLGQMVLFWQGDKRWGRE